mgnify:CR=1 FL=1
MDFKIPKFDELKDRLGIGEAGASSHGRASQSRSNDSYDEYGYEDYGEYGYDDSADYAQESSSSSFTAQLPKLVTSDDVRAHTQYTPAEPDDSSDASSQATRPNRDFAALREDSHRSPGVNSLFEPSAQSAAQTPEQAASALASGTAQAAAASATGAYAQPASRIPTAAPASGEGRVVQRAARVVTVIKPESYADAERIAKVLKSGDVAVVCLRNTPEALGKRILDFSFGVACALEAQVDCVAGHVFAITRGAELSDAETARLKAQGLM